MNLFVICPVRGHQKEETQPIVENFEKRGHTVYWPHRDTDQNDETGLRICRDNASAIAAADAVAIVWDGKSYGCLFDLGVAFALQKRIIPIELPKLTEGKSFQNMIMHLAEEQKDMFLNCELS